MLNLYLKNAKLIIYLLTKSIINTLVSMKHLEKDFYIITKNIHQLIQLILFIDVSYFTNINNYLNFYSLEDLRYQAKLYLKRSNNIPMATLGYKTPKKYRKMLEGNKKINSFILN